MDEGSKTYAEVFTISVLDAEELSVIGGVSSGSILEDAAASLTVSGTLTVDDPDADDVDALIVQEGTVGTAGIGTLLSEGIGDTIRVSLTEAPEKEIPVAYSILQAVGLRKTMVEYISCPSCGRTLFNLEEVVAKVRAATIHLTGLDIAVMGCIVNGPGEMADADYGYVGKGVGTIALYRNRDEIKRVSEDEGVQALVDLIKEDGKWVDP